jgi:acid phosphatase (class A)
MAAMLFVVARKPPEADIRIRNQDRFWITIFFNMKTPPTDPGTRRNLTLLMLLITGAICTHAAPAKNAYFGENTTPDVFMLLPMPPDVGSQEEAADRGGSLVVYAARTPEQVALGKAQNKLTVFHFSRVLGSWFQKANLPKTDALFSKLDREVIPLIENAKKYYQRPHPSQIDSDHFKDAIAKDETGAYPSGHATRATLYGIILVELIPNQRAATMALSREMAWLRVTGGVETLLDVFAGRVFGRALGQALMHNPEFLADFEEVRKEITTAIAAASVPATSSAPAAPPVSAAPLTPATPSAQGKK